MSFESVFKSHILILIAVTTTHVYGGHVSMIPDGPHCVIIGVKCYEFATEGRNWFQAEAYCRRNRGFLAAILNEVEMNLISKHLLSHNNGWWDFWIDGIDLADQGTFRWIRNGDIMAFTKWREGEPNNEQGKEHCAELHKQSSDVVMNDNDCSVKRSSICEYEVHQF